MIKMLNLSPQGMECEICGTNHCNEHSVVIYRYGYYKKVGDKVRFFLTKAVRNQKDDSLLIFTEK